MHHPWTLIHKTIVLDSSHMHNIVVYCICLHSYTISFCLGLKRTMEDRPRLYSASSLHSLCLFQIISSLEHFSPQLLSCIPPSLRYQIFLRSPIVDICSFENSTAFDSIDCEALWDELYQSHLKQWDKWKTEEFSTLKSMQLFPAGISNRDKYFALITTLIFCAEDPSGYIENLNIGHYKCCGTNN